MKKKILLIALALALVFAGAVIATKWSDYGDFGTSTQDTDTLLILDKSDTSLAATGTQKEWTIADLKTWLEVWLESLSPTFTSGTWDFTNATAITLGAQPLATTGTIEGAITINTNTTYLDQIGFAFEAGKYIGDAYIDLVGLNTTGWIGAGA